MTGYDTKNVDSKYGQDTEEKKEGKGRRGTERRRGDLKCPFKEEAELDNRFSLKDSASLCNLSFPALRANGPVKPKLKLSGLP